jgi:hypothetical protein
VNVLASVMLIEMWLFLGCMTLVIILQLLNGSIATRGLLSDKSTHEFSPARLQLLVATLFGALFYLFKALDPSSMGRLPEIPEEVMLLLGGSNILYLGAKSIPLLGALRRE